MNKDSKIYIPGHTGMVGSAIYKRLIKESFKNIIFKKSKNLDLKNQTETLNYFKINKPEYVFHAAAKVGGILANNTYKAQFIYDNTMISTNIIHSAYLNDVKKLINLGSSCIYPKYANQPIKETEILSGKLESTNEAYAIAKIHALKLIEFYNEQYNCNYISLMPTNLYGENDNYDLKNSHVLPALLRKMILAKAIYEKNYEILISDIKKRPLNYEISNDKIDLLKFIKHLETLGITKDSVSIWGSGEVKREFLHADDLARACLYFMKTDININSFINIGTGKEITIKELAYTIKDIVNFKGYLKFHKDMLEGTPRKVLDISKAKDLGWVAKINLYDGIKKTYNNYIKSLNIE